MNEGINRIIIQNAFNMGFYLNSMHTIIPDLSDSSTQHVRINLNVMAPGWAPSNQKSLIFVLSNF